MTTTNSDKDGADGGSGRVDERDNVVDNGDDQVWCQRQCLTDMAIVLLESTLSKEEAERNGW
jgi:hypothetical protein